MKFLLIDDHPLIREVMKDVLTEAMDIDGLIEVLTGIADGRIQCIAVDTPVPSQFSHQILNANPYAYLDDAPLEERRARAVQLRRTLPESVLSEVGALDQDAIELVVADAWPDVRDADELHDALLSLIAVPVQDAAEWSGLAEALAADDRAALASANGRTWWVAAERVKSFRAIVPASGTSTPASRRRSVDLPAPFGPTRPIRARGGTTRSTPASTGSAACDFETPVAASKT